MSLLEVEQQLQAQSAKRQQELAVLQVLAAMVETLHHSVLLRKSTQVSSLLEPFFPVKALALGATLYALNHAAAEIASLNTSHKGDVWLLI